MDTIVIGLDGLDPSLVRKWSDELPTLWQLEEEGSLGELRSSDPPLSSPAWQWIFTGKQGGKHDVFGFTRPKDGSYERTPVNLDDVKAEALWEALDDAGISCGVVNVPETYPPADLDEGFMISGWPIPNRVNPAKPESVIDELESALGESYKVNPTPMGPTLHEYPSERIRDELIDAVQHHKRAFEHLIEQHDLDVFFPVFTATDIAGHHLVWDHHMLKELYAEVDDAVAALLDRCPADTDIVLLSDHGHGARGTLNFHVNEWLREEGYLTLREGERTGRGTGPRELLRTAGVTRENLIRLKNSFGIGDVRELLPQRVFELVKQIVPPSEESSLDPEDVQWTRTKAFTGEQNVIFLNTVGAYPEGIVSDVDDVREEIAEGLRSIDHPERDQPLVTELNEKPDLFEGPYTPRGPDIVFVTDDMRCKVHLGLNDGDLFSANRLGEHRQYGLLVTAGPSFRSADEVVEQSVTDIFPLVLALSDIGIPENVDGEIPDDRVVDGIEPAFREPRDGSDSGQLYTDQQTEEIEEQLKGLGYLE